jgi:hypothetical protein
MSVTTATIDPGDSPSIAVSVDRISSADYQRVKLIDPTVDSTTPVGTAANPMKVLPLERGTQIYDSGNVAVAAADSSVTTATAYVKRVIVRNITSSQQVFSATNTAGTVYYNAVPIPPNATVIFDEGGAEWVGIRAHAGGQASALRAQFVGTQA